jgi:hypothetical protein
MEFKDKVSGFGGREVLTMSIGHADVAVTPMM